MQVSWQYFCLSNDREWFLLLRNPKFGIAWPIVGSRMQEVTLDLLCTQILEKHEAISWSKDSSVT